MQISFQVLILRNASLLRHTQTEIAAFKVTRIIDTLDYLREIRPLLAGG